MFLPEDKWSPRYETQFYTIRMKKYIIVFNSPAELGIDSIFGQSDDDNCSLFGICNKSSKTFPVVYYEIEVLCGTKQHTILRRYSQFDALCKGIDSNNNMNIRNTLPSKNITISTLFHKLPNDDFLNKRMVGLYNFMTKLLVRQECVNNPLVSQFLELNTEG